METFTSSGRTAVAIVGATLRTRIVATLERHALPAAIVAPASAGALPAIPADCDVVIAAVPDGVLGEQETAAALRRARPQVACVAVVLAGSSTGPVVRRALRAGFEGVVLEPRVEPALVATLAAVRAGQVAVPFGDRRELARPSLSVRERQVLAVLVTGAMNCEIADALSVSESTVKSHLASAFAKLGVGSRSDAIDLLLHPGHTPSLAVPDARDGERTTTAVTSAR